MRNLLICVLAVVALTASPSFAQPDIVKRPVQFAKGKSGATIKGSLTGDQTVDYNLRAAAGQTMTVKLSGPSTLYHNVLPPLSTGEALFVGSRDGNRSTITLPASGEYTIRSQPMGQCDFGVARSGGGTVAVAITRPDGRQRVIFFNAGKAVGANLSQADGDMTFSATQEADLYTIRAGHERYEIPEAVISGG
jgi:hypothetical protein